MTKIAYWYLVYLSMLSVHLCHIAWLNRTCDVVHVAYIAWLNRTCYVVHVAYICLVKSNVLCCTCRIYCLV